jgi:hypothetical protein
VVRCTTGPRGEVPGERKPMIRGNNKKKNKNNNNDNDITVEFTMKTFHVL